MSNAPYTVILKHGLPDVERELLRHYCHELHGSDGHTVLQFLCNHVDSGDPRYLAMEVLLPRRQGSCRLRIAHEHVFLIDGSGRSAAGAPALADNTALPD
jgi:hypothetical protein